MADESKHIYNYMVFKGPIRSMRQRIKHFHIIYAKVNQELTNELL